MDFYIKDKAGPRRAIVRHDRPGGVVESIVCDPGMTYREAEAGALDAARIAGIKASDRTVRIVGDPAKPQPRKMVSYGSGPLRPKSR